MFADIRGEYKFYNLLHQAFRLDGLGQVAFAAGFESPGLIINCGKGAACDDGNPAGGRNFFQALGGLESIDIRHAQIHQHDIRNESLGQVDAGRSESLAMRWIIGFARGRKGTPMHVALANEIKDAANNTGSAVRKRDDVHKMAQANRAFAHFRW